MLGRPVTLGHMNSIEILIDAAGRPLTALEATRDRITPENLNAHPAGHDNSIAWLLWHTGREIDTQLAALSGVTELWTTAGFRTRTGLRDLGDPIGYGHTPTQARSIAVEDAQVLLDYVEATAEALIDYVSRLAVEDLDDVIDASYDPPVTRGVRLVSIIDDAAQHIAQVAYVCGMRLSTTASS